MAHTLLPKPENTGSFYQKPLVVVFILLLSAVASFTFLYGVYSQYQQNSLQINFLVFELQNQKSHQQELEMRIQYLEKKIPMIEENLHKIEPLLNSINKEDVRNEISERFRKIEEIVHQQVPKEIDQTRNSQGQYVKSEDFFQIVNEMVETSRKKFKDLTQQNKIIQNLLQHRQSDLNLEGKVLHNDDDDDLEEESLMNMVGESLGEFKNKISDGAEKTFEKIKDLTKSTQEKLEPVKDFIVTNTAESMGKVKEFAQSTKDFVVTNADQSAKKIKEFSKTAQEKIEPIKEVVNEKVQQMKKMSEDLGEKTRKIAEKAKNFAKKFF